MTKKVTIIVILLASGMIGFSQNSQWTVEQANEWYADQPWLVGCNFLPSSAINSIEMWQASSWDPETIDKELAWAEELGFNTVRVYLNDLVFHHEKKGFLKRIEKFLVICQEHDMKPLFVFFDDCHWAKPEIGKQPDPIPGVHNSGWKQSPGWHITKAYEEGTIDQDTKERLEAYIKGVLTHFKDDDRILGWDLYNESGQDENMSQKLLTDTWRWAWEIRPSQPLTACVRGSQGEYAKQLNAKNSDVYSFHTYDGPGKFEKTIEMALQQANGRPILCTEYMARSKGNTFRLCLPVFKENKIACWNWGLVDGKSACKWPWSSRERVKGGDATPVPTGDPALAPADPPLWFHEIFRIDGTPYRQDEVDFIRDILKK